MNAGGVLNTCKSNGVYILRAYVFDGYILSGERVSKAWEPVSERGTTSGNGR